MAKFKPIHPGEILDLFLEDQFSTDNLSLNSSLSNDEINQILDGKKDITQEIAIKFAEYFNTSVEFWTSLQDYYNKQIQEEN